MAFNVLQKQPWKLDFHLPKEDNISYAIIDDSTSSRSQYKTGNWTMSSQGRFTRSASLSSEARRSTSLLPSRTHMERTLSNDAITRTGTPSRTEFITQIPLPKGTFTKEGKWVLRHNKFKDIQMSEIDRIRNFTRSPLPMGTSPIGASQRFVPRMNSSLQGQLQSHSAKQRLQQSLNKLSDGVDRLPTLSGNQDITVLMRSPSDRVGSGKASDELSMRNRDSSKLGHHYFGPTRVNLYHPLFGQSIASHTTMAPLTQDEGTLSNTSNDKAMVSSADVKSKSNTSLKPPKSRPNSSYYRNVSSLYGVLNLDVLLHKSDAITKKSADVSNQQPPVFVYSDNPEGCENLETTADSYEVPSDVSMAEVKDNMGDSAPCIPPETDQSATCSPMSQTTSVNGYQINFTTNSPKISANSDSSLTNSMQSKLDNAVASETTVLNRCSPIKKSRQKVENTAPTPNLKLELSDFFFVSFGDAVVSPRPLKSRIKSGIRNVKSAKRIVHFSSENQVHEYNMEDPIKNFSSHELH